jgi:hypothetical protein
MPHIETKHMPTPDLEGMIDDCASMVDKLPSLAEHNALKLECAQWKETFERTCDDLSAVRAELLQAKTSLIDCRAEFAVIEGLCAEKQAYQSGKRISGYEAIAWHCQQAIRALTPANTEQS